MLKKILYRKIAVASSLMLIILMLYFIPENKEENVVPQKLEYVSLANNKEVYLLDEYDYLARVMLPSSYNNTLSLSSDLIDKITIKGSKQDIIPNNFKPILPKNTKVLNLELNNKILKINFSKEFNNLTSIYEEKAIESLIYTLTNINGIDKLDIYVEGEKLEYLPKSRKLLPKYLDKDYGINKKYEMTSLSDISSHTIYYVSNNNTDSYYIPVTKYVNNTNQDKVKVIIDELSTSIIHETNLSSYLDANAKLLDYEIADKEIKLNFNDKILSNITDNVILEEVMYTIGLSLRDEFGLEKVIFNVGGQEKATFSLDNK